ncbi:MAG: response regulator [Chitinivibrionales bacterium]|nr:response regulator [Chitinivibrionales bacterium]
MGRAFRMNQPFILLACGHEQQRSILKSYLVEKNVCVFEARSKSEIFNCVKRRTLNLAIFGLITSDTTSMLDLIREVRDVDPNLPSIVFVKQSTEDMAITALRLGIQDYLKVPFAKHEFIQSVQRCVDHRETICTCKGSYAGSEQRGDPSTMIGDNREFVDIRTYLHQAAATESNVLLYGETGTGKELAAEYIHHNSLRKQKPFICINCAALPDTLLENELFGHERGAYTGAGTQQEGLLRAAQGGTIFFDEIGDMSMFAQAKILRAIESRTIQRLGNGAAHKLDIRIIAATNQDLEKMLREKLFRKDLYFRLNVIRVALPPLRKRKEDIPLLLDYFRTRFNEQFARKIDGYDDEVVNCFLRYDWPGNIRELRNVVEAAYVSANYPFITCSDLPAYFREEFDRLQVDKIIEEKDLLICTLQETQGNKSKAAEKLNWSRMTLYRKLARYRIEDGWLN